MLPIPLGDEPRPPDHTPFVNWSLVLMNVLVYAVTTARAHTDEAQAELFQAWGFLPAEPSVVTIFTSMFLHGDPVHLLGNLLYLWIFGANVEWCLGRVGYLGAYLVTGIIGTLVFWAFVPTGDIPVIGASGAISGVLGVYLIAFPRNRVRLLFFMGTVLILRWPAWLILAIWFVFQDVLPLAFGDGLADGVAHTVHLGSFAAGIALALVIRSVTARRSSPSGASARPGGWEKYLAKK